MTTHSVSAVCECTVDEIAVCSNNNKGELSIHYFGTNAEMRNAMQSILRSSPDAFLCKRVIICEGKTEVGILRALDKYRTKIGQPRFAHYGVGIILGGGGNKFFTLAKFLKDCGYDCCILMDSDIEKEEIQKTEARNNEISVFDWEQGYAIEEQLFKDVSLRCANALLAIAVEEKSFEHVKTKLKENFNFKHLTYNLEDGKIFINEDISQEERIKIGTAAKQKKSEWYKDTTLGECVGDEVFKEFETMPMNCRFKSQIIALQNWVTSNEN